MVFILNNPSGCRLGAFVAGMPGATPAHDAAVIEALEPGGVRQEGVVVQLKM